MTAVRVRHPFSPALTALSLSGLLPLVGIAALVTGRPMAGVLIGSMVFLTYRVVIVPWTLLSAHRRGVRDVRSGKHEWALEAFRDSEKLFVAHPWLDRYRWFFLCSGTAVPYATAARYNQTSCLAQLGRRAEALAILHTLESESPNLPDVVELRRFIESLDVAEPARTDWAHTL